MLQHVISEQHHKRVWVVLLLLPLTQLVASQHGFCAGVHCMLRAHLESVFPVRCVLMVVCCPTVVSCHAATAYYAFGTSVASV